MKRRPSLLILAGIIGFFSAHPLAKSNPHQETIRIRVRVSSGVDRVKVRGYDLILGELSDGNDPAGRLTLPAINKDSEWEIQCKQSGILVRNLRKITPPIQLSAGAKLRIQSPGGFINLNGIGFREELNIIGRGGKCDTVNRVDLEKYLDGLVNSEFSSRWPNEAIASQVVAARTYAYYKYLSNSKDSYYDLDSTEKDQVYQGVHKESFNSSLVVDKTRGLVLATQPMGEIEPIRGFYHSTCGGVTELPENVWRNRYPGFHRIVKCQYCRTSPQYQWGLELPQSQLVESLKRGIKRSSHPNWPKDLQKDIERANFLDLQVRRQNESLRVMEIRTTWESQGRHFEIPITGVQLRDWVGPTKLKSAAFVTRFQSGIFRKVWHFEGRGYGHGVGMCQWGAKIMGAQGRKMAEILKFYYPDAYLRKVY